MGLDTPDGAALDPEGLDGARLCVRQDIKPSIEPGDLIEVEGE